MSTSYTINKFKYSGACVDDTSTVYFKENKGLSEFFHCIKSIVCCIIGFEKIEVRYADV